MADILLFHHAQGLTDGIRAFANELRSAGHNVTVPDLYDGLTFSTVDDGVAHARSIGFGSIFDAAVASADGLPNELVYAGFSLGAMPAQQLAQQREGARAALLYHSFAPVSQFGQAWPAGVPLQVHVMQNDPWEDSEEMGELVSQAGGEFYLYAGNAHLFTDSSSREYAPVAAALVIKRTLELLDGLT